MDKNDILEWVLKESKSPRFRSSKFELPKEFKSYPEQSLTPTLDD